MGKREPQTILKTDERSIHLELGAGDNLIAKSIGWGENRGFLRATSSRSRSRTGAAYSRTCPRAGDRRPNCFDTIFRTTETAFQRW